MTVVPNIQIYYKHFCGVFIILFIISLFIYLFIFDQVSENQGVGGQPRPRSFGYPVQRRPGEQPAGHERRGDAAVLRGAQDAEVN